MWLAAAGQIFFSLSVGFGIIINCASYLRQKDDIVLSALSARAINEVFEVSYGGLITVSAAFVFLGASGALGGTFALGFTRWPSSTSRLRCCGGEGGLSRSVTSRSRWELRRLRR